MKNSILTLILIAVLTISCDQNKKDNAIENNTATAEQLYSCPMHPEITGAKGGTCSECGMELTEPVANANTESNE